MCAEYNQLPEERGNATQVSATIISSSPEEESYVMVLRNDTNSSTDAMTSIKNIRDVTFLVGEDRTPVYGVRAIICARSRALQQLIEIAAINQQRKKSSMAAKVRKSISQLNWFSCGLRRSSSVQNRLEIPITTCDVTAFQTLMTYIHCGKLTVDPRVVIGLMNAAYMFDIPEVLQACWDFAVRCAVRDDNFLDLLVSARIYKDQTVTLALMTEIKQRQEELPAAQTYQDQLNTFFNHNAQVAQEVNAT